MINNCLVFCFEGRKVNTERNYFAGLNENEEILTSIFGVKKFLFESIDIKSSSNYEPTLINILATYVSNKISKVFLIYDFDDLNTVEHMNKNLDFIIKIIKDVLNLDSSKVILIKLPDNKNFEYYLRLYFENHDSAKKDHDFIKGILGEAYKKKNFKIFEAIVKKSGNLIHLVKNLIVKNCEYIKLINKKIKNSHCINFMSVRECLRIRYF